MHGVQLHRYSLNFRFKLKGSYHCHVAESAVSLFSLCLFLLFSHLLVGWGCRSWYPNPDWSGRDATHISRASAAAIGHGYRCRFHGVQPRTSSESPGGHAGSRAARRQRPPCTCGQRGCRCALQSPPVHIWQWISGGLSVHYRGPSRSSVQTAGRGAHRRRPFADPGAVGRGQTANQRTDEPDQPGEQQRPPTGALCMVVFASLS